MLQEVTYAWIVKNVNENGLLCCYLAFVENLRFFIASFSSQSKKKKPGTIQRHKWAKPEKHKISIVYRLFLNFFVFFGKKWLISRFFSH